MIKKNHSGLKKPGHFTPFEMIPEMKESDTFEQVMNKLEKQQKGGFILKVRKNPMYYVKGAVLASKLEDLLNGVDMPVDKPVIELISEVPDAFIRIMPIPPDSEKVKELQDREDAVFEVEGGWFLNHEGVAETRTQPVAYYCTNNVDPGAPHKTYSATLRNCRICSYKIKR